MFDTARHSINSVMQFSRKLFILSESTKTICLFKNYMKKSQIKYKYKKAKPFEVCSQS